MFICEYCNSERKSKMSLVQHRIRCKANPNGRPVKPSYGMLGKKGTNQFTKEGSTYVVSKETRQKLSKAFKGKKYSAEHRARHSVAMLEAVKRHPDSYSKNNVVGRAKNIEYNGCILKGSWELKVAQYLDTHNIRWTNDIQPFPYIWEGKERSYFPDFYLLDKDVYLEVKGYKRDRDVAKWQHFPHTLIVIDSNTIDNLNDLRL